MDSRILAEKAKLGNHIFYVSPMISWDYFKGLRYNPRSIMFWKELNDTE